MSTERGGEGASERGEVYVFREGVALAPLCISIAQLIAFTPKKRDQERSRGGSSVFVGGQEKRPRQPVRQASCVQALYCAHWNIDCMLRHLPRYLAIGELTDGLYN